MTDRKAVCKALNLIAWGYLLLHLHFRLNGLDVLPDWAGYAMIFTALGPLAGEHRDLPLLKPFCVLLGLAAGADWLAVLFAGTSLTGRSFLVGAVLLCVGLYFHFQLLTDLARLADRRTEDPGLGRRLRICRNIIVLVMTATRLPLSGEAWTLLATAATLMALIATFAVAYDLFRLRGRFRDEEPEVS